MEVTNKHKMKFTKTEAEYNMKSIRFLLLTITTMFLIIACLMIVLGFSVYSHYHSFSFFYESAKSGNFFTPSILSIIMGMFLLIVTLFGFFGSLKQSTCMVNLVATEHDEFNRNFTGFEPVDNISNLCVPSTQLNSEKILLGFIFDSFYGNVMRKTAYEQYAVFLALILIVKLVVVVLAFTLDKEALKNYIYIPVSEYASDPEIEMEIDRLQVCLNCCGSNSYLDYVGMEFSSNHTTAVVSTNVNGDQVILMVPESCCINRGEELCTTMRANSCKSALINVFVQNASVIGVLGISVMFIQLLGVIFALLLARCIRKMKSERAFMSWKIKEQIIMAREEALQNETNRTGDALADTVYIAHHDCSTA